MPTDAPDGLINSYVVGGFAKGRRTKKAPAADVATVDTEATPEPPTVEAKPVPSKVTKASKK